MQCNYVIGKELLKKCLSMKDNPPLSLQLASMSTEFKNLLRPFMSQVKPSHYTCPRKNVYFHFACDTCSSKIDGIWYTLHVDHSPPSTHPCTDDISLSVVICFKWLKPIVALELLDRTHLVEYMQ